MGDPFLYNEKEYDGEFIMVNITLLSFVIMVVLLVRMFCIARENNICHLTLNYSTFPAGSKKLTIFFISDIHRRIVDNDIIRKVKGKADLVIIGGDLTEKGVPLEKTEVNLSRLNKIAPIYFIWGNNDYEVKEKELRQLFDKYKLTVLENKSVKIQSNHHGAVHLIGIGELSLENDELSIALSDTKKKDFKIVVCHNPEIAQKITKDDCISLLLSGHTHGGQIRIFGFGPYQKGKLHRYGDFDHLISNGYGTTMLPLRLGAHPETHLITIKHK